ncbi:MAG: helix-turn-helix domain-containing protein [Treponemataceae bacterium]|nr:helix-turn-helix domain-containing protein [Treponemataceae bacterium]
MQLSFLTRPENAEECQIISSFLERHGQKCRIYEDQTKLFDDIELPESRPDLLLFDYTAFNHIIFNVYNYMNQTQCTIPLIMFNDPNIRKDFEVSYWREILSLIYYEVKFADYEHVLTLLAKAINFYEKNNRIYEHISRISSGGQQEQTPQKSAPDYDAECFKNEVATRLTASACLVFEELVQNSGSVVPFEQLVQKIQKGEKRPKQATVRCAVSKIRTVIRSIDKCPLYIIKTGTGYKLIEHRLKK